MSLEDTPLHESKSANETKQLLLQGYDVNCKNDKGETPLHRAVQMDMFYGLENAEILIENGADVNIKDNDGGTPLHHAVLFSIGTKVAKLIIAKGANVNVKDNQGRTPIMLARMNPVFIDFLIAHGAK